LEVVAAFDATGFAAGRITGLPAGIVATRDAGFAVAGRAAGAATAVPPPPERAAEGRVGAGAATAPPSESRIGRNPLAETIRKASCRFGASRFPSAMPPSDCNAR